MNKTAADLKVSPFKKYLWVSGILLGLVSSLSSGASFAISIKTRGALPHLFSSSLQRPSSSPAALDPSDWDRRGGPQEIAERKELAKKAAADEKAKAARSVFLRNMAHDVS
jgi:hypothetical protein